jgi:hypothetical protein
LCYIVSGGEKQEKWTKNYDYYSLVFPQTI